MVEEIVVMVTVLGQQPTFRDACEWIQQATAVSNVSQVLEALHSGMSLGL